MLNERDAQLLRHCLRLAEDMGGVLCIGVQPTKQPGQVTNFLGVLTRLLPCCALLALDLLRAF